MPRYTFCSRCGTKKVEGQRCTCTPEQTRDRKEYQKQYSRENDKELNTVRWKRKRKEIIERDGCCIRCLSLFDDIVTTNLQVHHIKPRSKKQYRHLIFEDENLITLCSACNKYYNGKDPLTGSQWERLDFEWEIRKEERVYFL